MSVQQTVVLENPVAQQERYSEESTKEIACGDGKLTLGPARVYALPTVLLQDTHVPRYVDLYGLILFPRTGLARVERRCCRWR